MNCPGSHCGLLRKQTCLCGESRLLWRLSGVFLRMPMFSSVPAKDLNVVGPFVRKACEAAHWLNVVKPHGKPSRSVHGEQALECSLAVS